ncbi:hypothetical protein BO71DRAFT_428547 [Aspergillus ellipticus CBS 707.79]|uniref:Peptidase S33 tripeptidyl aminopeptidase-like C-terminal domain-containing protein n=1 Tax=Aspergillus ellipticus CBS 707.79 TaxID=1448320 RepID=A0A319E5Q3_9EURO|nr:hypothetical protein BO71DRAFT_428547 [Aspergillus ellipticus CBS 707.79]
MQQMAAGLKGNTKLKLVPKAGHSPMLENAMAFTEVVNDILAQNDRVMGRSWREVFAFEENEESD